MESHLVHGACPPPPTLTRISNWTQGWMYSNTDPEFSWPKRTDFSNRIFKGYHSKIPPYLNKSATISQHVFCLAPFAECVSKRAPRVLSCLGVPHGTLLAAFINSAAAEISMLCGHRLLPGEAVSSHRRRRVSPSKKSGDYTAEYEIS